MYNKSYKGRKYKFQKEKGRSKFFNKNAYDFENSLKRLEVIKYTSIGLALLILVGVLTVGILLYKQGQTLPIESSQEIVSIDNNDELLQVVNKNSPLNSDYIPKLKEYNGFLVNELCVEDLNRLMTDAQNQGVDLSIKMSYVSYDEQDAKYLQEYNKLLKNNNYTKVTAEAKAQATVPKAGTSEFQTGLLLSFDTSEKGLFENTKASQWLENNCVNYGFVLRYTESKKSYTSMEASPYIYRYVGKDNAEMMRSLNMCLNEYLSYISVRE